MERNNKHTDEAVSPVIGVILMVAITVILAAVIAAYVFGLVGTMNTTKMVAISVTQINNSAISVVTLGGQDLKSLVTITVSGDITTSGTVGTNVGARGVFTLSDGPGQKNILVIGAFSDGSDQVLIDKTFTRQI